MGMKILNEDGSILFEFQEGLGLPLLYRVLAVAKFTGEDQPEIILNPHVAALHSAVSEAMPPRRVSLENERFHDELAHRVRLRVGNVFRHAVLDGSLKWLSWSEAEKRRFVRDELFAPYNLSDQFLSDFVEEEDYYFADVRSALSAQ